MSTELMKVEFESLSGIAVKLDAATVRNTLTRGNGHVTDQEVAMFLRTCQAKRLDPLENGEVYLIKYDERSPAQLVVGCHAYMRRADHFPDYRGYKAGITVLRNLGGNPQVIQKEGACIYKQLGETLIGGWCRVFRERIKGAVEETFFEVSLDEYSTGKSNWNAKPATMIRKVAISQAFRSAFPNEYEGLYTTEEMQASGAIPGNYKVIESTGEIIDTGAAPGGYDPDPAPAEDDDPIISKDQKQALFSIMRQYFDGDEGNALYRELLAKEGLGTGSDIPMSAYKRIMAGVMKAAEERRASKKKEQAPEVADAATATEE